MNADKKSSGLIRNMASSPVAIFDLDHTLLEGDSELLLGEFMLERGLVGPDFIARIQDYYQEYLQGRINVIEYEKFFLDPLTRLSAQEVAGLRSRYAQRVRPLIREAIVARLDGHRAQGHACMLISASNSFVVEPIAELIGFTQVISTQVEWSDGRVTGRLAGPPALGPGKVDLLSAWLVEQSLTLDDSWGYSDSRNDLPLLKLVRHPVAVTPDAVLAAHAKQHGWEVLLATD
jgi:HAD superfamily hydrolase (TIGR01490 family)